MKKYKHTLTGNTITESQYYSLSYSERGNYREVDSETDPTNVIMSAAIGAATDSALLGGLLGG